MTDSAAGVRWRRCAQGWLLEYFTSRDVTLNEVLILKQAPGKAVFYYTRDAVRDAQLQMVRAHRPAEVVGKQ